jgi:homoserine dehydrogenase
VRKHNKNHPFETFQCSDNILGIYSRQYGDNPFTMQGGALGIELTAIGIVKDLLKGVDILT